MQDPIARFTEWLNEAKATPQISEPTAMTLATATKAGNPSARIVLLKKHDERGFVFFTSYNGRKSEELGENPRAALCFYWMPLDKQVRIEGTVEKTSEAEADAYFATRARESQIGAWASDQSQILPDRKIFLSRIEETRQKFEGKPVPRPPYWSGWRVVLKTIEFWQEVEFRLHERDIYTRTKEGWTTQKLYP